MIAAQKVNYVLDEFRPNLPAGVEIIVTQDRTGWSSMMVGELGRNILTALILVMTIVVGTMGLRSSTMVAAAIPTCFLFASIFSCHRLQF